jgi:hypothetical protein
MFDAYLNNAEQVMAVFAGAAAHGYFCNSVADLRQREALATTGLSARRAISTGRDEGR